MGLSIQPHIDAHVQNVSYAQDRKLGQNLGRDEIASRTAVFDQPGSEDGHLLHGENGRDEEHLGAAFQGVSSGRG